MYKKFEKSILKKSIIITVIFNLLISLIISNHFVFAEDSPPDVPRMEIGEMASDPYTGDLTQKIAPNNPDVSTLNNGRAWLDKSVSNEDISFKGKDETSAIPITQNEKEFVVSLSALAQSYPIKYNVQVPADIVFILDLSTSMTTALGDGTRASYMVKALNKSLETIKADNPENNRVGVVAYSGQGSSQSYMAENSSQVLLPLKRADEINKGTKTEYFTYSGGNITYNGDTDASRAVNGGTPTQTGILEAANLLLGVAKDDTKYPYNLNGEAAFVTRKPVLILLSDGEPTLGWINYQTPSGNRDIGLGVPNQPINFSTDFMTIVEASYCKKKVTEHYETPVKFYTVGVGIESLSDSSSNTNSPKKQARATLNPGQYAGGLKYTVGSTTYELDKLLENFVGEAKEATIPIGTTGPTDTATITNNEDAITDWKYNDSYYSVQNSDQLEKAFDEIISFIINPGNYTTEFDPSQDPDYSGYASILDPLGKYMEFKGLKGFIYDKTLYTGEQFARAIIEETSGQPGYDFNLITLKESLGLRLKIEDPLLWDSKITELINNSKKGGTLYYDESSGKFGNSLKWYANENLAYEGSYFDSEGQEAAAPEGADFTVSTYLALGDVKDKVAHNRVTSLVYMALNVITSLKDGAKLNIQGQEVTLDKGSQAVLWQLPGSLMPLCKMGEILESANDPEDPNKKIVTDIIPELIEPIRAVFDVGADTTNINIPPEAVLYANRWSGESTDDPEKPTNDPQGSPLAFLDPNIFNPYYYFTQDTDLYVWDEDPESGGGEYIRATSEDLSSDKDLYYREEYLEKTDDGVIAISIFQRINRNYTNILQTDPGENPEEPSYLYVAKNTRKIKLEDDIIEPKTENSTETYENVVKSKEPELEENPDDKDPGPTFFTYLGNNGKMNIINYGIPFPELPTLFTVKKTWVDNHDEEENPVRPDGVTVKLLRNGTVVEGSEILLNEDNEWTHEWPDLPAIDPDSGENIEYSVSEEVPEGYKLSGPNYKTGDNGNITATITNTLMNSLTIRKHIFPPVGQEIGDMPDVDFEFTITKEDDENFSQTIHYKDFESDGTFTITDLEPGTYSVLEEDANIGSYEGFGNYNIETVYEVNGDKTSEITIGEFDNASIDITNTYGLVMPEMPFIGVLKISKTVIGNDEDRLKEFEFTITFVDPMNLSTKPKYQYTGSKEGEIESGGTIKLKHGESIEISGILNNSEYTVTETADDGYTTESENAQGIISEDTPEVTFTNTSKKVSDDDDDNDNDDDGDDNDGEDEDENVVTPPPEEPPHPPLPDFPKTGDTTDTNLTGLMITLLGSMLSLTVFVYSFDKKWETKNRT